MRHLVSIEDVSKNELLSLIQRAQDLEQHPSSDILKNKVVAHLFFEPSTRTRLSFEAATLRLGGSVIGFSDASASSTSKGETLEDTIQVVAQYADAIIIRHPNAGAAQRAAAVSSVPVINAGDGANEHPTQTLLDLLSMLKTQGALDGLHIGLAGDLKYGRTVHSMVKALQHFNVHYTCISPPELAMPEEYLPLMQNSSSTASLTGTIADLDILYMTRVQAERFPNEEDYKAVADSTILKLSDLEKCKPNLKVLHPLPRVNEIDIKIDTHPAAYYFQQAKNGMYMRQAILDMLLNN